jgi:hypothetical protein
VLLSLTSSDRKVAILGPVVGAHAAGSVAVRKTEVSPAR